MKRLIVLIATAMVLASVQGLWASESKATGTERMQEIVYGASIDGKIAFYQKRLYLVDSEYKVLADIGRDAVKRIRYLKSNRQDIVAKMIASDVKLKKASLSSYIGRKMHEAQPVMEAYSTE